MGRNPSGEKMRFVSAVCITNIASDIRKEKFAKEKIKNPPKPGIRGGIQKLFNMGFPDEELIKRIQKDYCLNNEEDRYVILNILNDVKKKEKKKMELNRIEDGR